MTIAYICDGKRDCKDEIGCRFNKKRIFDFCGHTAYEQNARYGKCEGMPEWFPERFYRIERDKYWEKERL